MTRFLPIDRPLVYGDIVSYQPGGLTNDDRNVVLAPLTGPGRENMYSLLQIRLPGGVVDIEFIEAFEIDDKVVLVIEE